MVLLLESLCFYNRVSLECFEKLAKKSESKFKIFVYNSNELKQESKQLILYTDNLALYTLIIVPKRTFIKT